jgi:hypothetical protein
MFGSLPKTSTGKMWKLMLRKNAVWRFHEKNGGGRSRPN